jgi:PAS domain S-box-containing protein
MSNFNAKINTDGTILLASKIAEQVSGLSHENFLQTNFLEGHWLAFDLGVQARVQAAFQKAVAGETVSYEEKILAFGKEIIWINLSLIPVFNSEKKVAYIIAEGLNITDRKHIEEKLASYTKGLETKVRQRTLALKNQLKLTEEENEHSKILLESIGDGIVVTDQNGKVLNMNGSAETLFGLKKQDIAGSIFWEAVPFEDENGKRIATQDRPIFRSIHSLEKVSGTYAFSQKGDGKLSTIATSTPIIYQGKVAGVIVVFHDVTKEKEIEKSKTEFISLASHQLRTPLSSIRWHAEELLSEEIGTMNEHQKLYIQKMYNANQRMIQLTDMFLNVSRVETGSVRLMPEVLDLALMAKDATSDLAILIAEKKLSVEVTAEEGLPKVNADKNCVLTVFQNLIGNAVKYTPSGGRVRVTAKKSDGNALITVADSGIGIPKNDQPRIFTKLFRAGNVSEQESDGNGLGLYLVKSTIELLGGSIRFESEENKGTTFSFIIPFNN